MKALLNLFRRSRQNEYVVSCVLVRELEDQAPTYQHTLHRVKAVSEEVAKLIAQEIAQEQCYKYELVDAIAIAL